LRFVSADGKYLIKGDVLNLKTLALLKPSTRVNALKQSLTNTIADKDKIIYPLLHTRFFPFFLALLGVATLLVKQDI
jgi:hypothetical protein